MKMPEINIRGKCYNYSKLESSDNGTTLYLESIRLLESTLSDMPPLRDNNDCILYSIQDSERVLAAASLYLKPPYRAGRAGNRCLLSRMGVAEESRRHGLGSAIFQLVTQEARELGFEELDLMALSPAVPFYERLVERGLLLKRIPWHRKDLGYYIVLSNDIT